MFLELDQILYAFSQIKTLYMIRYSIRLACLLAVVIFAACSVAKTICPCEAPEIIRIGEKEIQINANISLIDTTASSKMKVIILLTTLDQTSFPPNINADYYYLRSSNLARNAYEGKFTKVNTDSVKGIMKLEVTNAPYCEQGELVDIAVHLVDSRGKIHFLKKGDLPVHPAKP